MRKNYITASLLMLSLNALAWNGSSWMSELPGNAYVAQLSIPGTHDSATGEGWPALSIGSSASQTQDLKIQDQLNMGIRALDIRPGKDGNELYCAHGITNTTLKLKDCLDQLKAFLEANPNEFLVIHLYPGNGDVLESQEFANLLNSYDNIIAKFRRDLTVDDVRGKMLVFSRSKNDAAHFSANLGDWSEEFENVSRRSKIEASGNDEMSRGLLFVQDIAKTDSDTDTRKSEHMINLFNFTSGHQIGNDPANLVWAFNFASAYSGGISSSSSYKKNATTHNKVVADYFSQNAGPAGIVMMDYVGVNDANGVASVNTLIENNFKYTGVPVLASGEKPVFSIDRNWMYAPGMYYDYGGGYKAVPMIADFNGNGRMDYFCSGQAYKPVSDDKWDWGDVSYMAFNKGFGNPEGFEAYNNSGVKNGEHPNYSNPESHLPIINGAQVRGYADFNNDGAVDFIVWDDEGEGGWGTFEKFTPWGDFNCRVYLNNGDGTQFTAINGYPNNIGLNMHNYWDCSLPGKYHRLSIADVNMDGYPDILMNIENGVTVEDNEAKWYNANGTNLFINNGDGTFTQSFIASNRNYLATSLFGDFNCDGYPDILLNGYHDQITGADGVSIPGGYELVIMTNDGKGNFSVAYHSNDYTYSNDTQNQLAMHVLDYDQDGKLDILLNGMTNTNSFNNQNGRDGRIVFVLKNCSENGNVAFSELLTDIHACSDAAARTSILADFNGDGYIDYLADGWGPNNNWSNHQYISYSKGNQQTYELHDGVINNQVYSGENFEDEQMWTTFGDINGDGMLDLISPNGNKAPRVYLNKTLAGKNATPQVPSAPTGFSQTYDNNKGRLTITWDEQYTESGSKAIYNTYIRRADKARTASNMQMRVPADVETGKLKAYTEWSSFLPSATCFYDGLEEGVEYEIGVQSVGYNYNASKFVPYSFVINNGIISGVEELVEKQANLANVYTLQGIQVKKNVAAADALTDLPAGIYIVNGKKMLKK